jgi:dipeptidyl aminopeptidase/acylaminoacyl peptidase
MKLMRIIKQSLSLGIIVVYLCCTAAYATKPAWTLNTMLQYTKITAAQASPDGKYIAIAASKYKKIRGYWQQQSQIYLASADGKHLHQLTFNNSQNTKPQWSPTGKWLAFITTNKNNISKINIIPNWQNSIRKNNTAKIKTLITSKTCITKYKWSHNNKMIAYIKADQQQNKLVTNNKLNTKPAPPTIVGKHYPTNRLWLIKFNQQLQIIVKPHPITNHTSRQFDVITNFAWSIDNKNIVFAHHVSNRNDTWNLGKLSIVNLATKKIIPLLKSTRVLHNPLYSPNGKLIAFIASKPNPVWNLRERIFIIAANGGKITPLAWSYNQLPQKLIGWSRNNKNIYFKENYHTYNKVYALPINGTTPINLTSQNLHINTVIFSPNNKYFTFIGENNRQPNEVYFGNTNNFIAKQITHFNVKLPTQKLPITKTINWQATDGTTITGLLTFPINYQPGKKYPLLVEIHGGPADNFVTRFIGRPSVYPIPIFSTQGYFYLRSNIRGSNGYGYQFRAANYHDWGGKDYHDILDSIDYLHKKGMIDMQHIGILGWSYGGYLTAWSITQNHLFKAAIFGGGITDLISYSTTTDLLNFVPAYLGTYFWNNPKPYLQRSPIMYINNAKTPTLMLYGANDTRVPPSQGIEFYNALKIHHIPTKLIIYPNTKHSIKNPNYILHANHEILAWLRKYL